MRLGRLPVSLSVIAIVATSLLVGIVPVAAEVSEPPVVGESVQNDVSPPLADIAPIPPDENAKLREPKEKDQKKETKHFSPAPLVIDPVKQGSFGSGPAAPAAATNFDGVGNLDGVYPPDTNGDVGPNHYVQWVNLHFQIFNKSGVSLYGPAAGNTLWSGFGGPCQTLNSGDPIVLYDSMADRWLMAQFTSSSPFGECVAISTSGDPTGSWYRYFFQFSTSVFYDYPHFGIWPDGYYMSMNRFTSSFQGASAIVFDRSKMLTGQPAAFREFKTSIFYGSLLPSDLDGATPPAGAENVFAEIGGTALHLWKFHVDWTTPANSTFTGPASLPVAAFNQLCPTTASCIPQPGTGVGLDGLGDRLMYRLAYRNFGDHEALVVNHSVNVATSGTQAGVRWYEIRDPRGAPTLYQQGSFAPDSANRWMGSLAMDKAGDIAMGYSVSSGSISPSIRYTGRLAGDTLGQMTQGETTLVAGLGSQTGSASRWGDYSMMSVDPVDDCTFWYTSEYMPTTGGAPWKTRIGSFRFPSCGGAAATVPGAPTLSATAGDSVVHLSWTVPSDGGSAITGYNVYRDTNPPVWVSAGTTYDDTSVTNGTTYSYTVTAVNAKGEGGASNPVSATPQAPPTVTVPSAALNLSALPASFKGVSLSWSPPASDGGSAITGYEIWRSTKSGAETKLTSVGVATSYLDSSTRRRVQYYYKVLAVNVKGAGLPSNEASAVAR